jgi:hypothetical protein
VLFGLGEGRAQGAVLRAQRQAVAVETGRPTTAHGARHFLRHLGEMLVAMVVGIMVLGMLDRGILATAGTSAAHMRDRPWNWSRS